MRYFYATLCRHKTRSLPDSAPIGAGGMGKALICVMVDEYDAAFDQIEQLLSIPSFFSVPLLKLDPHWDPLRTHPRYKKVLQKYHQAGQPPLVFMARESGPSVRAGLRECVHGAGCKVHSR